MSSWVSSALLGFIQGVTEFLPISSDGHLTLLESFLPGVSPDLVFNVFLHGATLLATLIYFRKDVGFLIQGFIMSFVPIFRAKSFKPILKDEWMISAWLIIVISIPTGVVGLVLRHPMETHLMTRFYAAVGELITGVWILVAYFLMLGYEKRQQFKALPTLMETVAIGVMQGLAVLPGVSRSGTTVGTGLMFGIDPRKMARLSFLMGLPAILAAFLLEIPAMIRQATITGPACLGFALSFLAGLGAIHIFLKTINRQYFWMYGVYCLLLGSVMLIFF